MEDRSWMSLSSHCCPQYLRRLKSFIQIARADMEARSETTMYCPCLDCGNDKKYSDFEVVYAHLIIRGFVPNYTCWNKHGEEGPMERGEWVAYTQEAECRDDDQDGQGNCDQEGCRDDINEECILEFSDDQFDALVDNVEEMIHDVRGEDEMTEAELRKYKQFVEDSKKNFIPIVRSTRG